MPAVTCTITYDETNTYFKFLFPTEGVQEITVPGNLSAEKCKDVIRMFIERMRMAEAN